MSKETSTTINESYETLAFEEIEHTADRALRIYGLNLEELLRHAAQGMNSLMLADFPPPSRLKKKSVVLDAPDVESLLVDWLSELAYWAEIEMLVFQSFDFHKVSPTHVAATLTGGRAARLEKHIKAVTYHNLKIVQTAAGLTATVVFDV
jgi:SHS2 domain-containing protein